MNMLMELWAYSPGETAAIVAITAFCGVGIAMLIIAMMWPETDDFEEAGKC
ncbi:MAG: hypothetical protein IJ337_01280 [Clostridia bacterium]|nr:hypothetical protein [Clostridia bacterium]